MNAVARDSHLDPPASDGDLADVDNVDNDVALRRESLAKLDKNVKYDKNVKLASASDPSDANVGLLLTEAARRWPDQLAVVEPAMDHSSSGSPWRACTLAELEEDSRRIADGYRKLGAPAGSRVVLLLKPGIDFIASFFGMLKAGMVCVLIDPGIGRAKMLDCLDQSHCRGLIGGPFAQLVRVLQGRRFREAKFNVIAGKPAWLAAVSLDDLRAKGDPRGDAVVVDAGDAAAIIFTSGSTGPSKGVLYSHDNFNHQARYLRSFFDIRPGERDLSTFPLFALFNCAMGVTTVIPKMDFTRPASADPRQILRAIKDWGVTQAFGSPALWNTVGRAWEAEGASAPELRRVFSAGAPVPPHVLRRMRNVMSRDGEIHTPYGATEALPVASISSSEVLGETVEQTQQGAGVCVGRRFEGIQWRVIAIDDRPLESIEATRELPPGRIGELMVRGPVVSRHYVTGEGANALHKVRDGHGFWHRMGDVGYLDDQDRFWFCGRKSHRVATSSGVLFTIPCEAIFNQHPRVYRSALVGVGLPGRQQPVILVELWPEHQTRGRADRERLLGDLRSRAAGHPLTRAIQHVLIHPGLPVDARHNAKIFRERLSMWAAMRVPRPAANALRAAAVDNQDAHP